MVNQFKKFFYGSSPRNTGRVFILVRMSWYFNNLTKQKAINYNLLIKWWSHQIIKQFPPFSSGGSSAGHHGQACRQRDPLITWPKATHYLLRSRELLPSRRIIKPVLMLFGGLETALEAFTECLGTLFHVGISGVTAYGARRVFRRLLVMFCLSWTFHWTHSTSPEKMVLLRVF